jgi:hypothetical protein
MKTIIHSIALIFIHEINLFSCPAIFAMIHITGENTVYDDNIGLLTYCG